MAGAFFANLLCAFVLGSSPELTLTFENQGNELNRRADCVTENYAIEVGMDNTSSARDSVHQAVFYAKELGLKPMVVVIDQDNKEDAYQQEIRIVTEQLGIPMSTCKAEFLVRWVQTSPERDSDSRQIPDDLAKLNCDLGPLAPTKLD